MFLGSLNPLSSKSIIECCILSILLYGSESWILNDTLLKKLESFPAEIGKRIFRLPKHTSNRVIRIALRWPSVRARVLFYKLVFLWKLMTSNDSLSLRVFRTLAVTDVESIHHTLDRGLAGTSSALALLKLLSLTSFDGKCSVPDCIFSVEDDTAAVHSLSHHTDLQVSLEDCVRSIVNCSDNSFHLGLHLHNCFRSPWSTS